MNDDRITPRAASTVVLFREKGGRLQVYLLKRSAESGFFPGNYVFPGGAVESGDRAGEFWLNHADLDRDGIEERFGKDPGAEETLGYCVAGIRETFEEAAALLARKGDGASSNMAPLREARTAGKLLKGWLREQVADEGWVLSLSILRGWSHWITPEAFRPRFDTRFFLAFMPEDQECAPDMRETIHGTWIEPPFALEGNMRGDIALSPPTLVTLQELSGYRSIEDLDHEKQSRLWGEARLPRLIKLSKGAIIIEPWDPLIDEKIRVDEEHLKDLVLPIGVPFSRIWLHKGIWRPVGV
jgi:8-oxo-dGTP pyrophosphatase MutT (NUDIX family)